MRRVKVFGDIHDIPDDREWIVQAMEMDRPDRRTSYQYRFPALPGTAVQIQKCTEDLLLGYGQDQELPHPQDWEQMPPKHINEFLLVEDGQEYAQSFTTKRPSGERLTTSNIDEMFYRNGTLSGKWSDTTNWVDMAATEKRFIAALDEPMKKQVNKNKKKTKRSQAKKAPMPRKSAWMDDPCKEAAFGTFATDYGQKPIYALDNNECEEGEDMSNQGIKFPAGTRVTFRSPQSSEWEIGTIVGRTPEMRGKSRPGCVLVATDKTSKYNDSNTKYTGRNHGTIIDIEQTGMQEMDDPQWELVPEHIGIVARKGFIQDDVKIPTGSTGRIINDMSRNHGTVSVSWNFHNANFSNFVDAAGKERNNIWEVPSSKINLCNMGGGGVKTVWPGGLGEAIEHKVGDLCKVSARSVSFTTDREQEVVVSGGTVVELLEYSGDRYKTWYCRIIGGCADSLVGQTLKIRASHMKTHPKPDLFYRPGQQVEIVAKIDFRKKPLQGMKGKVILSTDSEGDVGIEFPDDIGAGSLDGIGREGHCIYIEASLVKSSE
jgi:hypothetical protein